MTDIPTYSVEEILDWFYLGDEDKYTPEAWAKHKAQAKQKLERVMVQERLDEQMKTSRVEYDDGTISVRFRRTEGLYIAQEDRITELKATLKATESEGE